MKIIISKLNPEKASKIFYNSLVVILLVLAVAILLTSVINIPNGYKLLIVESGSMEPATKKGSLILSHGKKEYAIGDIVTFGSSKNMRESVTHRIVEIKNDEANETIYITKGDANDGPDSVPVKISDVRGKSVLSIPYLGYPLSFLKTKQGLVVMVIVGTIIVYSEVMRIQKEAKDLYRKRKEKTVKKDPDEKAPA